MPPANGSRNGEKTPQYNPIPHQQSVEDIHSNHNSSAAMQQQQQLQVQQQIQQQQQQQHQLQQQQQQNPLRNTSGVSFAQQMPSRTLTPTRAVPQQLIGVSVSNQMNSVDKRQQQQQPAQPLFQRFMTEDAQEIKTYARLLESQGRKLNELETIHNDLEQRLEIESNARQRLEKTLEERERKYEAMIQELQTDRDHWKKLVEEERTKNSRLMDQVNKKEQDILQMVQRKFNHPHRDGVNHQIRSVRSNDKSSMSSNRSPPEYRQAPDQQQQHQQHRSPHEILAERGSMETARTKNATNMLFDFFGL